MGRLNSQCIKPFTLSLIVLLLLPYTVASQAKNEPMPKKSFGITLESAAANLLTEIENKFHKSVREETYPDPEPSNWAEAKVDDNGVPLIRMNTTTLPSEAIIVHELFRP